MFKTFLYITSTLLACSAQAGIRTPLLELTAGKCSIRIHHDATPSAKTGVIIFRSYKIVAGIHQPCPPSTNQTRDSLRTAMGTLTRKKLKPVNEIMIGRIMYYPWIQQYLATQPAYPGKVTQTYRNSLFNNRKFLNETLKPFQDALVDYRLKINKTRCEKILINKQGVATDALCWLHLQKISE